MARPPLSVQLYTVRNHLNDNPESTIAALAAMGFTAVEPFGLDALDPRVRDAILSHGLDVPTAHGPVLEKADAVFRAARELGCTTVVDPWQPDDAFTTRDGVAKLAQRLSAAAEQAAEHGITVGYHNHDHELRHTIDGVPALLVLAELSDERVVFELDVYWCTVAGADPVAVAKRLGNRLIALHMKDGDPAAGVAAQVVAGTGGVPLAATLAAAPRALAVIEFDELPPDGLDAISASRAYVSALEDAS